MRYSVFEGSSKLGRRILLLTIFCMGVGIAFLIFTTESAFAFLRTITQSTVADFNTGFFYHTGLTSSVIGGGDGNGEVRLLTIGINPTTWNPGGSANTTGLPALWGHAAVQKNGRIYVSGGRGNSSTISGVFYTDINTATHNLSNWITSTNSLPGPRLAHGMVAANNYLYVIGGLDSLLNVTNTVLVATINSNGSVGTWSSAASLPAALSDFTTVVVSGTIYVLGGDTNGTAKTAVYYTTPNVSTGAITSWITASAPLPKATSRQSAAVFNGTIYQFGGADFSNSNFYPDVLHAIPSGVDVTSWITDTGSPLPSNLVYAAAVAFGGQAYVAGGASQNGAVLTSTIASNLINPDGSILNGSWANSNVLSTPRQRAATVVSDDGWIYVIEGNSLASGSSPLNTIDYGPTSAAGASAYAPSGNFVSAVIDLGGNYNVSSIKWNSTVTSTPNVSLSLQYRHSSSLPLNTGWSSPFGAIPGTLVSNTISLSQTARYMQYQANYTTTVSNLTPALNFVQITFDVPPSNFLFLPIIKR